MNSAKYHLLVLLLVCNACVAIPSVSRVDTPIERQIATVTASNPTSHFRWPLRIAYSKDGQEWAPADCDEAMREIRNMVPSEYLTALSTSISSARQHGNVPSDLHQTATVLTVLDYVERDLDVQFPGEGGFIDAIEARIERGWVRGSSPGRAAFVRSCKVKLGPNNEQLWYALIFAATASEK